MCVRVLHPIHHGVPIHRQHHPSSEACIKKPACWTCLPCWGVNSTWSIFPFFQRKLKNQPQILWSGWSKKKEEKVNKDSLFITQFDQEGADWQIFVSIVGILLPKKSFCTSLSRVCYQRLCLFWMNGMLRLQQCLFIHRNSGIPNPLHTPVGRLWAPELRGIRSGQIGIR